MARRSGRTAALAATAAGVLLAGLLPATADAASGGTISGRVVDSEGTRRVDALVQLITPAPAGPGWTEVPGAATRSGTDGRFTLPQPATGTAYIVRVCTPEGQQDACEVRESSDYIPEYVGADGAQETAILALTGYLEADGTDLDLGDVETLQVGTVRGNVGPAAHRQVLVGPAGTGPGWGLSDSTVDDRGRYTVFGLAPGSYRIYYRWPGVRARSTQEVTVREGRPTHVDLGTEAAVLRGRVVKDGRPMRRATVEVYPADRDPHEVPPVALRRTDRHGRYLVRGLPPSEAGYRVLAGRRLTDSLDFRRGLPLASKRVRIASERDRRTVDFRFHSRRLGGMAARFAWAGPGWGRLVEAEVFDVSGEFVGLDLVRNRRHDGDRFGPGRFRLGGLAAGTYWLRLRWATIEGDRTAWQWEKVRVRRQRVAHVGLLQPRRGDGVLELHAPTGSTLTVVPDVKPGPTSGLASSMLVLNHYGVGADGEARAEHVPPGRYWVLLEPNGESDRTAPEPMLVEVGGGENVVDVPPGPVGASITGVPINPATGEPWPWNAAVVRGVACAPAPFDSRRARGDFRSAWPTPLRFSVTGLAAGEQECQVVPAYEPGTPFFPRFEQTFATEAGEQLDVGEVAVSIGG